MILRKLALASFMAVASIPSYATVYDFTYTDTIGSSSIDGVKVGDKAIVHLLGNNGASSIANQSFSWANMLGFTVDVGSYHGSYSLVWQNFNLTTDASGHVSAIEFYGTDIYSQNSDSIYGDFAGDFVYGNAVFNNPNHSDLFIFSDTTFNVVSNWTVSPSAVPVPATVWLFGSGLIGLVGAGRKRKAT